MEINVKLELNYCVALMVHTLRVRRNFKMGRPKEMMIGLQIEVTGYKSEEGLLEDYLQVTIFPVFLLGQYRLEIQQNWSLE